MCWGYEIISFQRKTFIRNAKVFPLNDLTGYKPNPHIYRKVIAVTEVVCGIILAIIPGGYSAQAFHWTVKCLTYISGSVAAMRLLVRMIVSIWNSTDASTSDHFIHCCRGNCHVIFLSDWTNFRKTSSIRHTKSQTLNASCFILKLSLLNPLKTGVTLRTKM